MISANQLFLSLDLTYPANLTLIASMNPCPGGYFGDSVKECTCSAEQIQTAHVAEAIQSHREASHYRPRLRV